MKGEEQKAQPSPGNKAPSVGSTGFCTSPQGPRGGSGMSWAQQAGLLDSLGSPARLALFPTVGERQPPARLGRPLRCLGPQGPEYILCARGSVLPTTCPVSPGQGHSSPEAQCVPGVPIL